ncbi:MAG: peptidase M15 [Acidimicrobiia bacterium]|nr:peptidase M15 [Acidimicrobiia bacterium]
MDRSPRRGVLALLLPATALAAALLWSERGQATTDGPGPPITAALPWPGRGRATTDGPGPPLTVPPTSVAATGLHPGLGRALAAAVSAAGADGHTLTVTSGFRTADEQARLLAEAVDEHGSEEAALHWVFPPERSMHVQGLAVDVGDGPAADWLDGHGAAYGLCRTLAWEWWHFEWRAAWETTGTCPGPVDDPAAAPGASL